MARSPLEDFERKVARYAPTTDVAGTKVLCACQGDSQPTGATGRLVQIRAVSPTTRHVKVYCSVPIYGPSESIQSFHACHEFVTLTK